MRKADIAVFGLLFAAHLAFAQAPELPGWKLVWSDEFNYAGHPDPTKWGYEEGYVRHNELQYYTVNRLENARVDGQHLFNTSPILAPPQLHNDPSQMQQPVQSRKPHLALPAQPSRATSFGHRVCQFPPVPRRGRQKAQSQWCAR